MNNQLYYGDNLEVLQNNIPDESVDLCYIDPPFNSKRDYNQIYNNIGKEDRAQAQAFVDTWKWNDAAIDGLKTILVNEKKTFPHKTVCLIRGLKEVLGESSSFAYIISMTLRIAEIHRVLKPTGSFYLHCDPTASHYLKLVLDTIFIENGGEFKNEIIWSYKTTLKMPKAHFGHDHDVIFYYTKSKNVKFHPNRKDFPVSESTLKRWANYADESGFVSNKHFAGSKSTIIDTSDETKGFNINQGIPRDVWDIPHITGGNKENMHYPTQKPEKLLERIIETSSDEGDVVLDAYCGCGTTVAVAQRLNRNWIGIDITYQSISLILKRLEESCENGKNIIENIDLKGSPKDLAAAAALAHKKDDRTRKEFEKWAVLLYSNNYAYINEKKGADKGIDGIAEMAVGANEFKKVLFSVKSGKNISVKDIREFLHVIESNNAAMGIFITLEQPTKPMLQEAKNAGKFKNPLISRELDKIQIVTIEEILANRRMELPMMVEVLKSAERKTNNKMKKFDF